jgi:catechol 2,3-dioxygenase-like lactoylglutathione lyase family enzyme
MQRRTGATVGAILLLASGVGLAQEFPRMVRSNPADLPLIYGVRISTPDLARSEKFYREALGARQISHVTPTEFMVQFKSGLVIMVSKRPASAGNAPAPDGAGGFILEVADIDAAMSQIAAAGGRIVRPASDGKSSLGIRSAFIFDPDGVGIELSQLPATQPVLPARPASP